MSSEVHGPPILPMLALMVSALVYLRGWYRLQNAFPNVLSVWRLAAFMGGLFSWWAAAGSPLAGMDHYLLTAHMAQHLLLILVLVFATVSGTIGRTECGPV
jgi:putative membrane protein